MAQLLLIPQSGNNERNIKGNFMRFNYLKVIAFSCLALCLSRISSAQAEQSSANIVYLSNGLATNPIAVPTCATAGQLPVELKIYGSISVDRGLTLYSSSAPIVNFDVAASQANSIFRIAGVQFNQSMFLPSFSATLTPNQSQHSITSQNFTPSAPLKVFTGSELAAIYPASSGSPRRRFSSRTDISSSVQADSGNLMYVILNYVNLNFTFDLICQ